MKLPSSPVAPRATSDHDEILPPGMRVSRDGGRLTITVRAQNALRALPFFFGSGVTAALAVALAPRNPAEVIVVTALGSVVMLLAGAIALAHTTRLDVGQGLVTSRVRPLPLRRTLELALDDITGFEIVQRMVHENPRSQNDLASAMAHTVTDVVVRCANGSAHVLVSGLKGAGYAEILIPLLEQERTRRHLLEAARGGDAVPERVGASDALSR